MTDLRKTLEQSQAITEGAMYGPWRIGPCRTMAAIQQHLEADDE